MIDYEADAPEGATAEQLKQLGKLIEAATVARRKVDELEAALKAAKRDLDVIECADIPALLDAAGLASVEASDGTRVSVVESLYASIPKKNKADAARWLRQHGQGGVIKRTLSTPVDDDGVYDRVVEALEAAGVSTYAMVEDMNTGTVKAIIKELLGEGVDVPLELFGAYLERRARLEPAGR